MKKKVLKIALILMALAIVSTFVFVCVLPKIYLAHKYDTKIGDYKIVDYVPNHLAYDLGGGFYWEDGRIIYEYKVNGRQFEVDFFDFQYYDSYQMEDVEKWMVEELQENIDKNIYCIDIDAGAAYGIYDEKKDKYKNVVWTKDMVYKQLDGFYNPQIYILCEDFEKYLKNANVKEIKEEYNYTNKNEYCKKYMNDVSSKLETKYNMEFINVTIHKYKLIIRCSPGFCGIYSGDQNSDWELYSIK